MMRAWDSIIETLQASAEQLEALKRTAIEKNPFKSFADEDGPFKRLGNPVDSSRGFLHHKKHRKLVNQRRRQNVQRLIQNRK